MDEIAVREFRERLQGLKSGLQDLEAASTEAAKTVDLDQTSVGRLSRMDAMQGQQMALETARRREQKLAMIDAALRRIDAGEFGFCFICSNEIDPRRLEVDPSATRCVACMGR